MKIIIRLILLTLILAQFNQLLVLFPHKDKTLEKEYEKVLTIVKTHCSPDQYYLPPNVTVEFDKLYEEIAYCQIRLSGFKLVFDKSYWTNNLNEIDRTQIMMHEMTHCLFRQKHVEDPRHYMAEFFVSIPQEELDRQFSNYLQTRCKK